jgi:hypothetical protein
MRDEITAAAKASPPVAVTAWHYIFDMPIEKWVAVATFVYVVLQIVVILRDRIFGRDKRDTEDLQ